MVYNIGKFNFDITTKDDVATSIGIAKQQADKCIVRFDLSFAKQITPSTYSIVWKMPLNNAIGIWDPLAKYYRQFQPSWAKRWNLSRSCVSEPIMSVFGNNDTNRVTVALSELSLSCNVKCGIDEYGTEIEWEVLLFCELSEPQKHYSFDLLIDERPNKLVDVLADTKQWWANFANDVSFLPDCATDVVYSAWYNFHQDISQDVLQSEMALASKLGFGTLIVDDGWQTEKVGKGYGYCGDWCVAKNKFYDLKGFVDYCHKLGIKVMFWYSVPFVGYHSANFERFRNKYLYEIKDNEACVLDPRYKEVRDFLVQTYVTAVKEYGFDGFKLDYIDSFVLTEQSNTDYENMDYRVLNDAVKVLLHDIYAQLHQINPDILIEFRQGYIGPVTASCGNMFRVADCVSDMLSNKLATVDLRMALCHGVPHTDPISLCSDATPEHLAKHLLYGMFGVPQLSLNLGQTSKQILDFLQHYVDFYNANKKLIIQGKLSVKDIQNSYSQVTSTSDGKSVTVCYSDAVVKVQDGILQYVFNATNTDEIFVDCTNTKCRYQVVNCNGTVLSQGQNENSVFKVQMTCTQRLLIY